MSAEENPAYKIVPLNNAYWVVRLNSDGMYNILGDYAYQTLGMAEDTIKADVVRRKAEDESRLTRCYNTEGEFIGHA